MKINGVSLIPAAIPTPYPHHRGDLAIRSTRTSDISMISICPTHSSNSTGVNGSTATVATTVHATGRDTEPADHLPEHAFQAQHRAERPHAHPDVHRQRREHDRRERCVGELRLLIWIKSCGTRTANSPS